MTHTTAFTLLLSSFLCQSVTANPLHPLHERKPFSERAPKLQVSDDLHIDRPQPVPRAVEERLPRQKDNESMEATREDDVSFLQDHSELEDSDLDGLLDELGLSYSNVRDLVKRDPAADVPATQGQRDMNVVYYAQTPATGQVPLTTICADPNIDVVILSFITDFYTAGGYPTLNLASKCWAANAAQAAVGATGLIDCVGDGFATQVATCQQAGKKVMLSVGGAIATNNLPSADAAVNAAKMIWGLFLGGTDPKLTSLRPFGPNIKLDGIDIDNEAPAYATFIPDLVKALRSEFTSDPSKTYYLSAAPQCPRPDQSIPMPRIIPELDFVFVQFYNNPSCNLPSGSDFLKSLRAWSQDLLSASSSGSGGGGPSSSPASGSNSPQPPSSASHPSPFPSHSSGPSYTGNIANGHYQVGPPSPPRPRPGGQGGRSSRGRRAVALNSNSNPSAIAARLTTTTSTSNPSTASGPKLFIGVLATPGSGYVDPSGLKGILEQVKALGIPNLGGVMYWDGAYQALSASGGGKTYAQVAREVLA